MCDCDDRRVGELVADSRLDQVVSVEVDGRSGFVQYEDLGLAEQRSGQTHQLPLTNATTATNTGGQMEVFNISNGYANICYNISL